MDFTKLFFFTYSKSELYEKKNQWSGTCASDIFMHNIEATVQTLEGTLGDF